MQSKLKTFRPLILIVLLIIGLTIGAQAVLQEYSLMLSMRFFMGFFFLLFAFFKLLDIKGFVMNFAQYDIVAKRVKAYAWAYPFIETTLAYLYLTGQYLYEASIVTAVVMFVGSIGVIKSVQSKQKIHCACLGAVIKLPMTTVTIIEDIGMGVMALIMIGLL